MGVFTVPGQGEVTDASASATGDIGAYPSIKRSAMQRRSLVSRSLLGLAIAASLALPVAAHADAIISKDLQQRLDAYPTHRVIVTFSDRSQISRLSTLTNSLLPLKSLPMVGALLTSSPLAGGRTG